ncbi:DUF2382 domain-containing protein [Leptolyngbya sp. NIES-2104]|uniref:DUF2382 domain-containing protein n=1 Tax=Leptolyngbya sp. NIES-2104 TaxID=1552121 RepID=UPI0006EC93AF|nr:DUF2382 domain-containing protein [Leptolyngbya sp. NIES-2104]GAP94115.1 hypothetical protein NIES2104_06250 [Leptolyngbya sp. NIES-2104]
MPLHTIKDFDPQYQNHFDDNIVGFDLYAGTDKVGSVEDLLVDDSGKLRYLIINTGAWIFGKKVLLPIGSAQIDSKGRRVVVNGLTRTQVEALPQYDGKMPVDYEHEEQVRKVYRPMATGTASLENSASLNYDRNSYAYDDHDPALYNLDESKHQNLRLYEERLIASKTRAKTGEVSVGKRVETETAQVSVPIEKERVVIERTATSSTAVTPDSTAFQEGEVARMEVYEETADVRKEAFVREEVSIRKEVDQKTVTTEETLRREELDVDTEGRPVVDKGTDSRSKKRPK